MPKGRSDSNHARMVVANDESACRSPEDVALEKLHTLDLAHVPLTTPALKHARLIKNAQLDSVIEIFNGKHTGSGQYLVSDIDSALDWLPGHGHNDREIMVKLAALPSFDRYSLRMLMRGVGVPLETAETLQLSPDESRSLAQHMAVVARPLIRNVFGSMNRSADIPTDSFESFMTLFKAPQRDDALSNIQKLSARLMITFEDMIHFLEDFGDIHLSFAHYRTIMETLSCQIAQFLSSLKEIRSNWQLSQNRQLMLTCDCVERRFGETISGIATKLREFEEKSLEIWDNLSPDVYHDNCRLIRRHHSTIAATLCLLGVKMNAWQRLFPDVNTGGPVKKAEFIMINIRQGIQILDDTRRSMTRGDTKGQKAA